MTLFDVRVFNPNAKRYLHQGISKIYELNKKEKKKFYNERIIKIKHGSFIPLVMSATGEMGRGCKKFYSRLTDMISRSRGAGYNITVARIRRKITFLLMQSIGICLRSSCSIFCSDSWEQSINREIYTSVNLIRMFDFIQ